MLLGTIIANLSDEDNAVETPTSLEDLGLLARMCAEADAAGEPLARFATLTVGNVLTHADDTAWLSLMAVTRKSDNPGEACLRHILATELRARSRAVPDRHEHAHNPGTNKQLSWPCASQLRLSTILRDAAWTHIPLNPA